MAPRGPAWQLSLLAAMVEQLEAFLASDSLTRRLLLEFGGRTGSATMSLGILLNTIEGLCRSPGLTFEQRELLRELIDRRDSIRAQRRAGYGAKLQRELKSHLDSWRWYLSACVQGDRSCREDYDREVWLRIRIEQLLAEAELLGIDVVEARGRLAQLDRELETVFAPGEYVGPGGQESAYPRDSFWWLHGRIAPETSAA